MSHFVVGVILPDEYEVVDRAAAQEAVKTLLAPYNEELKVDPYDDVCYCVGGKAHREAADTAAAVETLDSIRERFAANQRFCGEGEEEARQELWQSNEFYGAFDMRRKQALDAHPLKGKPDPDCDNCNGTGTYKSTYNTESKWDWYVIGGRWTGLLSGYDPQEDPANKEICDLCNGRGDRHGWVKYELENGERVRKFTTEQAERCNGCNGCKGTGVRVKWNYVPHGGDVSTTESALACVNENGGFFALVTPDGEWAEKGRMGWWAIVSDEKPEGDWIAEQLEVLNKYPSHAVVVVDCHI